MPLAVHIGTVHVIGSHRIIQTAKGYALGFLVTSPLAQLAVGEVFLRQITHHLIVLDAHLLHQRHGAVYVFLCGLFTGIDVAFEAWLRLALLKFVAHAVAIGCWLPVSN